MTLRQIDSQIEALLRKIALSVGPSFLGNPELEMEVNKLVDRKKRLQAAELKVLRGVNVKELNPGRELDALIAEKVMGWKYTKPDEYNQHGHLTPGGEPRQINIPLYSTDIAAAWQVVEKLKDARCVVWKSPSEPAYEVTFEVKLGYCEFGYSNSAPHAICLAALKAVGASKGE